MEASICPSCYIPIVKRTPVPTNQTLSCADFRNELSPFGAIYTLLETWPTQSTRDYLDSETDAPRQLRQSHMLGTSQEILKTMSRVFARVVPSIIKEMQVRAPRSSIEQHLHELLASMQFVTPIPAIKVTPMLHASACWYLEYVSLLVDLVLCCHLHRQGQLWFVR